MPESATFAGQQVWKVAGDPVATKARWEASRPFVDRYLFAVGEGTIILDELNWWPLLHPLKCQFLVPPEQNLSGADKDHLRLCAGIVSEREKRKNPDPYGENPHYPWITPERAERLVRTPPVSGGGALANRYLKQQILNWGVADAPIVLGTMQKFIRKGIEGAFVTIASPGPATVRRVAITESLGSFVLFDAMKQGPKTRAFVEETADLFFIANQFALLELGRIALDQPKGLTETPTTSVLEELDRLPAPPDPRQKLFELPKPRQVVAFSDPSDILTYVVPELENVHVANIFAPVSGRWLFAWPPKAHRGALGNRLALDLLFRTERPTPRR